MSKFMNALKKFGKDEDGASLVEYAVLLGVVLGLTVIAMQTMATSISGMFAYVTGLLVPPA